MKIDHIEIAKLELKPGDCIAVRIIGREATVSEMKSLKRDVENLLGDGVKCMVYSDSLELSVISNH